MLNGKKEIHSMNTIMYLKSIEICLEGITRNCQHSLSPREGAGGQGLGWKGDFLFLCPLCMFLILNCTNNYLFINKSSI